jgi:hypothetical protein
LHKHTILLNITCLFVTKTASRTQFSDTSRIIPIAQLR